VNYVTIPLAGTDLRATVDHDMAAAVLSRRWRWEAPGRSRAGRVRARGGERNLTLPLFVLGLPPGTGVWVKFRDGNPLNCTRANLRVADPERSRFPETPWEMYLRRRFGDTWPRVLCPRRHGNAIAPQRCLEFQAEFGCGATCAVAATGEDIAAIQAVMLGRHAAAEEGIDVAGH
jgi:hypothetical protein